MSEFLSFMFCTFSHLNSFGEERQFYDRHEYRDSSHWTHGDNWSTLVLVTVLIVPILKVSTL